jgi:hypothetical protein
MIKRVITRLNFAPEIYFPRKLQTQWRLPIGSLHQTLCSIQTTYQKTLTLARISLHARTLCAHTKTFRAHQIYICAPSQPMQLQTIQQTTWLSLSLCLSLPPLEMNTDYTEFHFWISRRDSSPLSPPKSQSHSDPQKGYKRGVSGHSSLEHSHSSSSEHQNHFSTLSEHTLPFHSELHLQWNLYIQHFIFNPPVFIKIVFQRVKL